MADFQTDALRPSSLPTATLGRRRPAEPSETAENLDKVSEEWNVRIDREVRAVSSGLKELIELADIGETPNADTAQINALHLKLKTSQLIRSAQGIRDIAHELKLMLLLSDQVEEAARRDREAAAVSKDVEDGRTEVSRQVRMLWTGGAGVEDEGGHSPEEEPGVAAMEVDKKESGASEPSPATAPVEQKDEQMDEDQDDDDDDDLEEVA